MNHDVPHYHRITIRSREPDPGGSTIYGWVDCDGNCLAIERRLMTRRVRIENVGVVRATRIERGKVKTTHDWTVEDVLDKLAADDIIEEIQKKDSISVAVKRALDEGASAQEVRDRVAASLPASPFLSAPTAPADDIVEQIQKKEPITIGSWITFKQRERWNDGVVREIFQGIPVFYEIVASDWTVHRVPADNVGVAIKA